MELTELKERVSRARERGWMPPIHCANGLTLVLFVADKTQPHVVDVMTNLYCPALPMADKFVKKDVAVEVVLDSINRNGGLAGKTWVGASDVT